MPCWPLRDADDVWLDVGAGGGRYALPLALSVSRGHRGRPFALDARGAVGGRVSGRDLKCQRDRVALADGSAAKRRRRTDGPRRLRHRRDRSIRRCSWSAATGDCASPSWARRRCDDGATLFWHGVHGEDRVRLPALPEFVTLLFARGRLPEITWVDRPHRPSPRSTRRWRWRAVNCGCAREAPRIGSLA